MTDSEFESFLSEAASELRVKQDALEDKFSFGTFDRWWFAQATGKLQFFDKQNHLALEASVIDIGSFSPNSETWKWAWSNKSVLPRLREKAESLKALKEVTGMAVFAREESFEADEEMAWELAAIAVKHLGAIGCYRAPAKDGPHLFLAITHIQVEPNLAP